MKNFTKKIFSSLFTSSLLLSPFGAFSGEVSTNTTDLGYFVAEDSTKTNSGGNSTSNLYKLSSNGAVTLLIEDIFPDVSTNNFTASNFTVDANEGKIYFLEDDRGGGAARRYRKYDIETNTFDGYITISGLPSNAQPINIGVINKLNNTIEKKCESTDSDCDDASDTAFVSLGGEGTDELIRVNDDGISTGGTNGTNLVKTNTDGSIQLGADGNDIDVVADGLNIDGTAVITKNADGTIQIGTDENDIDITSEGLAIDGDPLITKKSNGELHIGKNSWITKEENGRQKVYAKDANGNPIPIDYTNGTKLLINGRDVEQSINNVGALSAALTGLPTVPTDTTLACGLGTGTHGGDFAFSGGCASKVNEKLSINYAASMTMPGQDYAGDFEDQFSARAGFVWKLGKATKPTQISINKEKELKKEISNLKETNKNVLSSNQKLEDKVFTLMARLERLEKVALGDIKSKDLAIYKIK